MNPEIIKENYNFCDKKEYQIPHRIDSIKSIEDHIKTLPQNDDPEIFGLSEATSVSYKLNEITVLKTILENLLTHPEKNESESLENEVFIKIQTISKEVPMKLNEEECGKKYPIIQTNRINSVLHQEISKYNELLDIVKYFLCDLEKALKGECIMTEELENVMHDIKKNIVPNKWQEYAYPNLMSLPLWIKDLSSRVSFIQNWIAKGDLNIYRMAIFFNPKSFLIALTQNFASRKQIPIDNTTFEYRVGAEKSNKYGKLFNGFYIEGAVWNNETKYLIEPEINTIFNEFPQILFNPIDISKKKRNDNVSLGEIIDI